MAAGFMPLFGDGPEEYCPEECAHTDCARARELRDSLCRECGKPMHEQVRFYRAEDGEGWIHAICARAS